MTDADLAKEATPNEYIKNILPILLRNGIVHFLGFGNRLGFDPLPYDLQVKLICIRSMYQKRLIPSDLPSISCSNFLHIILCSDLSYKPSAYFASSLLSEVFQIFLV